MEEELPTPMKFHPVADFIRLCQTSFNQKEFFVHKPFEICSTEGVKKKHGEIKIMQKKKLQNNAKYNKCKVCTKPWRTQKNKSHKIQANWGKCSITNVLPTAMLLWTTQRALLGNLGGTLPAGFQPETGITLKWHPLQEGGCRRVVCGTPCGTLCTPCATRAHRVAHRAARRAHLSIKFESKKWN